MNLFKAMQRWWNQSLQRKLVLSNVATVLLTLALLGYLSNLVAQNALRTEVSENNLALARLVAQDIQSDLTNIWSNVQLLMFQLDTSSAVLSFQAQAMLDLRRASPDIYRALYLFNANGSSVIHLNEPPEELAQVENILDILARPPITPSDNILATLQATSNARDLYISPTYFDDNDDVPYLLVGIPLVTRGFENLPARQYVVAQINLGGLARRVEQVRVSETGRVMIVSENGQLIAHPDPTRIGQPINPALEAIVTAGVESQTTYHDSQSGEILLGVYSPVSQPENWGVVVTQTQRETLASIEAINLATFGVGVVALLLGAAVSVLTARTVTSPLRNLAATTQDIATTGNLSQSVNVAGDDEVSQLAHTFNRMTAQLRVLYQRLEKQVDAVVDNAPVLLIAVDRAACITLVAGKSAGVLDAPPDQLIGKPLTALNGQWHTDVQRGLAGEAFATTLSINERVFEAQYTPIHDDHGTVEGVTLVATDVTERFEAESARQELQTRLIEAQQETIRELSTPIIPIMDRVVVLPLVGRLDTARAQQLLRALLHGIRQHRAKVVILDVTGVIGVDAEVASYLDRAIQAARLKGAQTILTGVSNEMSTTIIELGLDWKAIPTVGNLQAGLRVAVAQRHSRPTLGL